MEFSSFQLRQEIAGHRKAGRFRRPEAQNHVPGSERFATGFNLGVNGLVGRAGSYAAQQFVDNAGNLLNVGRRKIDPPESTIV